MAGPSYLVYFQGRDQGNIGASDQYMIEPEKCIMGRRIFSIFSMLWMPNGTILKGNDIALLPGVIMTVSLFYPMSDVRPGWSLCTCNTLCNTPCERIPVIFWVHKRKQY